MKLKVQVNAWHARLTLGLGYHLRGAFRHFQRHSLHGQGANRFCKSTLLLIHSIQNIMRIFHLASSIKYATNPDGPNSFNTPDALTFVMPWSMIKFFVSHTL